MLKQFLRQANASEQDVTELLERLVPGEVKEGIRRATEGISKAREMAELARNAKMPSIEMPDNLNITDPTASLMPAIESAIKAALEKALLEVVKKVVDGVCGVVNEAMEGKVPNFGSLKEPITRSAELLESALETLGITEGTPLIMDSATFLSGAEMADLLEGRSTPHVKQLIKSTIRHKHPRLKDKLSSGAQIDEAFKRIGDVLGPDVIARGRQPVTGIDNVPNTDGAICAEPDGSSYGNRLSPERAKEQESAEKQRLRDLADELSNLADRGPVIKLPPVECDGAGQDPIVPNNIPSMDYMTDTATSAIFSPVQMAFNKDASRYLNLLIVKESKELQEGEIGYAKDGERGFNEQSALEHNQTNPRINLTVSPTLRKDLRSRSSYLYDFGPDNKFNGILFKATAINTLAQPIDMSLFEQSQKEAEDRKIKLKELKREQEELLDDGLEEDPAIAEEISLLEGPKEEKGSILYAEEQTREEMSASPPPTEQEVVRPDSLEYKLLANPRSLAGTLDKGFRDHFKIRVTDFPLTRKGELRTTLVSRNRPKSYAELAPSDDWEPTDSAYQAEAFASFITDKIQKYGVVPNSSAQDETTVDPSKTAFYENLRSTYPALFLDFLTKIGRQVSSSKYFNPKALEEVELVPDPTGNDVDPCAPLSGEDPLSVEDTANKIKDGYSDVCEPLGQPDNSTTLFENACKDGVVELTTRLSMMEIMLKSVFVFSQFSSKSLLKDRLVVEYMIHKMKSDLNKLEPGFYRDLCIAAREIINKRISSGEELKNLYGVIDMCVLIDDSNPRHRQGKEALKYIALEQLPGVIDVLNSKIKGSKSSIHRKLIDPPVRIADGRPVRATLNGGWIRTIDVPKSYRYGENKTARFQRSRAGLAMLKYPDLKNPAGTLFFERYIRIEDRSTNASQNPEWRKLIRQRPGGPDNPNPEDGQPHLSGVVNIDEWEAWIDSVKDEPGFDDIKIDDYFQPWKFGMRLIWLPPMKPGTYRPLRKDKWKRFDPKELEVKPSANLGIVEKSWREYYQNNNMYGDLLDTEEPVWKKAHFQEKGQGANQDVLGIFDKEFDEVWDEDVLETIARKEKALAIQEKIELDTTSESVIKVLGNDAITTLETTRKTYIRPVRTIPLITAEEEVGGSNMLGDYVASSAAPGTNPYAGLAAGRVFDRDDDLDRRLRGPYGKLKIQIRKSAEYRFLFNYVIPLPRMLSLITIYTANSISLSNLEVDNGFATTKDALRTLFYTLSPDEEAQWYSREDPKIKAEGGSVGQNAAAQTGAVSPSVLQMILDTVPILVRGCAEQLDPHYALVSRLTDLGVWPLGKTFASVPVLWPINFSIPPIFFGWGPPLTPLGAVAYTLPQTSRDKKKERDNKASKETALDQAEQVQEEDCGDLKDDEEDYDE
jgi:hypothetical protein